MLICDECGEVFFEEDVQHHYYDDSGDEYGSPCCNGDFADAYECKMCGEYFRESELHNGVCDECLYEHKRDYALLEKFAEEWYDNEPVELSPLITSTLTAEQINGILLRYIEERDIDCSPFIKANSDDFADKLKEL